MLVFKITTIISDKTYSLTVRKARTLQEAINGFQQFFYEEYDYDPMALPIPIDIKIVNVDD